jgi:cytochrome c oxidase assembly factor 6
MGFWSSESPAHASPPKPKISSDGTPIAPDRSERAKCWEARDLYFKCLDAHDIVDSIKEESKATKECGVENKGFEANCASSWVSAGYSPFISRGGGIYLSFCMVDTIQRELAWRQ